MTRSSFRNLRVWQEAMTLTIEAYEVTANFPKHEIYGLTQQIRRAAVSIPSNIAEGKGHRSDREFVHFLMHARGSLLEMQTQLLIAEELGYFPKEKGAELLEKTDSVGRSLNGLIGAISGRA